MTTLEGYFTYRHKPPVSYLSGYVAARRILPDLWEALVEDLVDVARGRREENYVWEKYLDFALFVTTLKITKAAK